MSADRRFLVIAGALIVACVLVSLVVFEHIGGQIGEENMRQIMEQIEKVVS